MVYVGRSRDSLPFVDEVGQYGDRVAIRTDDVHGLPTADDLLGECADGTAVYACGPAPMLTAIRGRLAGRDNVELHFERFAAPPVVDGKEFSVCIASTGEVVDVGADETLLSALQRSGVQAPYSCQQGFCGTCRTGVLGGTSTTVTRCSPIPSDAPGRCWCAYRGRPRANGSRSICRCHASLWKTLTSSASAPLLIGLPFRRAARRG